MSRPFPVVRTHVANVWTSFIDPASGRRAAEDKLVKMGVVPTGFRLHHGSNGVNLIPVLHASHKKYPHISMTPFLPALENLIQFVKGINDAQSEEYEKTGIVRTRHLYQPQHPAFANLSYELVIMFPQDFLAKKRSTDVYSNPARQPIPYCVGYDGTLRKSPGLTDSDPRLAPFPQPPRDLEEFLNPLLVAIHADIKFRHFLSTPEDKRQPLHPDVTTLIEKTMELVDHIFWDPRVPQAEETKEERSKFLGKF